MGGAAGWYLGPMATTTLRTRWASRWGALPRWIRVPVRVGVFAGLVVTLVAAVPYGWVRSAAAGHLYEEGNAPRVDVLIVLGAEVAPGGSEPMPFLKGRLDTAAALYRSGAVKVILVSGDAHGGSGNETSVMTEYLVRNGVDERRVVTDPSGLDTYDSCVRAGTVYGVQRALVVTQAYHLPRAVALCRQAGLDVDGVASRCDGCGLNIFRNAARDYFASTKAAWDAFTDRPPAVVSPTSDAIMAALS
jgi:vancomycin permeability regulator SanA